MAPPKKQALEVAQQFRKALALDLVTNAAPAAYEMLKLTVKRAVDQLHEDPSYKANRQEIDSAKQLLLMAGVSEPQRDLGDKDVARLSLAELNAMIDELRIIEGSATDAAQPDTKPLEFLD